MTRLKYLLLAQIVLVPWVAFCSNLTASCELADRSIVGRASSGLAEVSNLGLIEITCRMPARSVPTTSLLKVATRVYEVSPTGSLRLVPSGTQVTGGMDDFGLVPPQEGVIFVLNLPLGLPARQAEAQRLFDKMQNSRPEHVPEITRQEAVKRIQKSVSQHRVGQFLVECRLLDGTRVMGIGIVQLEVLFKGRFSDI